MFLWVVSLFTWSYVLSTWLFDGTWSFFGFFFDKNSAPKNWSIRLRWAPSEKTHKSKKTGLNVFAKNLHCSKAVVMLKYRYNRDMARCLLLTCCMVAKFETSYYVLQVIWLPPPQYCAAQGSFNNYADQILPSFNPLL